MEQTTELENQNEYAPQDLSNATIIFARALGLILDEGQGIVVDIDGQIDLGPNVKKVIVFKYDSQIHIYNCDQDLLEGTAVTMNETTTESE